MGPERDRDDVARDVHTFVAAAGVPADAARIGMAFPGTFILDRRARVTSRFFEDLYIERNTVSSILMKAEYVTQTFDGFARRDIRSGGKFNGFMLEAVTSW